MDVLNEILEWSQHRPSWQRDCLRRLATGALSEADIAELADISKAGHGITNPSKPAPAGIPLELKHLGTIKNSAEPVVIVGIRMDSDVNAVPPGTSLSFHPVGLTAVYGDNGAGKSSYARVLRHVCRARSPVYSIRPNVFKAKPGAHAAATISYRVGTQECQFGWTETSALPSDLSSVTVFDSDCAGVYVDEENEVAYLPLGLDLLASLADVADRVRAVLDAELRLIRAATRNFPELAGDTQVGRLLATLSAQTRIEDVERLASPGEEDARRMEYLRQLVVQLDAEDPLKSALALQLAAERMEAFARTLSDGRAALDEVAVTRLEGVRNQLAIANEAARAAAEVTFNRDPLPNVGADAWRALWEAARKYSEQYAYPGRKYPVTGDGAVCVLCQQELGADALDRLARFDAFVRQEAQNRLREAEAGLSRERTRLLSVAVPRAAAGNVVDELRTHVPAVGDAAAAEAAALEERQRQALQFADTGVRTPMAPLPASPVDAIREIAGGLRGRAAELQRNAQPAQRSAAKRELLELEARSRLASVKDDVYAEIRRRNLLAQYAACIAETDTHAITRRSSELTEAVVSSSLRDRFAAELDRLGLDGVTVSLEPTRGSKGAFYHRLQFKTPAISGTKLGEVLSEGEHRSVALAALMAEIAIQPSASTLVVDDPVSSLDHLRRERVARRLAEEAKGRPVVVFTHDLVFLLMLQRACTDHGVQMTERHLRREVAGPGIPMGDRPWHGMQVKQRLGVLRDEWQRAEKEHRSGNQQVYEALAKRMYGLLRETWERAVEEVLLNDAIQRMGLEVQTKRLDKVTITPDDLKAIEKGMSKTSKWLTGHDAPAASYSPIPAPEELSADIAELEAWVGTVRKRRG